MNNLAETRKLVQEPWPIYAIGIRIYVLIVKGKVAPNALK
jgi:hypothetical protein